MLHDQYNDTEIEEHEPQLTSSDPNERKLARKLRIERRCENIRRQGASIKSVEEEDQRGEIQLQVQKSAEILEKFIKEGDEYVTNVRVASNAREVDRREAEGVGREKVIEQLENEALAAQVIFDEIAEKWSIIENYKDPLHINEEIQNQKEKCDMVIRQKDSIIAMLREEVKTAERNFTKDQRKQMDDINILAARIEKQVTFMRRAYQKEFELIEEVILTERKKLIDMNNKKWEELYKKREIQEVVNSDKKFEQLEEFDDKMTQLRIDFEEKFRETYIKLEIDIDCLQRELERIKALALLNSEKLDYNYQILKKREDENIIIKSQQKRRINKLQDVINMLRAKIQDYELTTNNLMRKLSDEIKRLQNDILLVEEKADHFAKVNDEKFLQIWTLNKDTCEKVLKKIIDTDRVLHEQQMGIQWSAPVYHIMKMTNLRSYKDAVSTAGDELSTSPSYISTTSSAGREKKVEEIDFTISHELSPEVLDTNPIYKRLLNYILKHISDKTGFLTEKRLKELLNPYEDDQKTLVRLDNVFASLGINNKEDIDLLVTYFVPYAYCPTCSMQTEVGLQSSILSRYTSNMSSVGVLGKKESEALDIVELEQAYGAIQQPPHIIENIMNMLVHSESSSEENDKKSVDSLNLACGGAPDDKSSTAPKEKKATKRILTVEDKLFCEYNHQLLISPIYVLRALREFVMVYYEEREGLTTTGERLKKKRNTISRLLAETDIKKYWNKFKKIYNEDRIRVWDALFDGLKKYHEILKDRKILCEEVVDLRRQNRDLKRLLANYIDHREILTPPCSIENQDYLSLSTPPYTNSKM